MEDKLYIPLGVKPEAEFFKGFGKKQMIQAAVGSLCCGAIALVLWAVTKSVTAAMISALAGVAGSVMMTAKDQSKGQKKYPYRYGKEWEVY